MKYIKTHRCSNINPHLPHIWVHWWFFTKTCPGVIREIKEAKILGVSIDLEGLPHTSIHAYQKVVDDEVVENQLED